MFFILLVSLVTYLMMIISTKYKLPISIFGLSVMLIYGSVSTLIPINLVFETFPFEIVSLIIVLALFTKKIESLGFFHFTSDLLYKLSKKNKLRATIYLIFMMYIASMFMNNLTVILLFTFIFIRIAIELKLPIVPILVSAIIASNIGGAALPWADTPAVILTLYTNFGLNDFLTMLFIPCLFFTVVLVAYLMLFCKKAYISDKNTSDSSVYPDDLIDKDFNNTELSKELQESKQLLNAKDNTPIELSNPEDNTPVQQLPPNIKQITSQHEDIEHGDHKLPHHKLPHHPLTHPPLPHLLDMKPSEKNRQIRQTILLFTLLIIGICIAPFINISISLVVMICGSVLLFLDSKTPEDIINTLPVLDSIVFITTLFFIGTILDISGLLGKAVDYIFLLTGTNRYFLTLVVISLAFLISTFLSAGPAAATLLPICVQLTPLVNYKIVYAALALGILAGSSMLPWSATGGPIMLGEVNRFLKQNKISKPIREEVHNIFNLKHYLRFSIPFSLFILCSSIVYLFIYISILYT